jgi:hypothetical protein
VHEEGFKKIRLAGYKASLNRGLSDTLRELFNIDKCYLRDRPLVEEK